MNVSSVCSTGQAFATSGSGISGRGDFNHLISLKLVEGDTLGLVVSDANGSTIRFIVRARDILHTTYRNRRDALKQLSAHTDLTQAQIFSNPYTAGQPERPGFLLAWRADQIRRVDLPRPGKLVIWRHGWGREDNPDQLTAWGIGTARKTPPMKATSSRGQGWQTSAEANRAIERRAMDVARRWLIAAGYRRVDDVSSRRSWDFEARRTATGPIRHVEVKAITGTGLDCRVTRNEVDAANASPGSTLLLIVNGIRLQRASDGTIAAAEGAIHAFDPWTPSPTELRPEIYRWKPTTKGTAEKTTRRH